MKTSKIKKIELAKKELLGNKNGMNYNVLIK